jgi:hypothetical protein
MHHEMNKLIVEGKAKQIPNFPSYSAVEDGRIYSHITHQFLKPDLIDGRRVFKLIKGGKRYGKYASRWIAMTFHGVSDERLHVDHIDNDKTNDVASNLQWLSHADNVSKSQAKSFEVVSPDGDVVLGKNIRAFCREHNLHNGNFSNMLRGCIKFKSVRGWTLHLD